MRRAAFTIALAGISMALGSVGFAEARKPKPDIAFSSNRAGGSDIWTMASNGSGQKRLTHASSRFSQSP